MSAKHVSLSGAWSGAYRYRLGALPETVFTAIIEERHGRFTGVTQEPNLVRHNDDHVVTADIDGVREGFDVRFGKFMNGSGGMRHVILYEGVANADITRIEGEWKIPGDWTGTFFMERDDAGIANEAQQTAEVEIKAGRR